jgi:protein ImuB
MFAAMHGSGPLYDCASDFSPRLELAAEDTVVLDIRGLDRLFGTPRRLAEAMTGRAREAGLAVNVAVARNPDAAVHAARALPGITVIPDGQEHYYLEPLPLALLGAPPAIEETFRLWGLRRFGDLAALPEPGVAERLGTEGIRLRKLACGVWERPLRLAEPAAVYEETLDLEHPITLLESLAFLLTRMLAELCRRVRATNELRLLLGLENGGEHQRAIRLPTPTRDHRTCWKLLQLDLETNPPGAPVVSVRLAVEPAAPRFVQQGLFAPLAPEPEKLEVTLARIGKLVGPEQVGTAELLDTHRPGAFQMRRFGPGSAAAPSPGPCLALRVFRPPLRATVQLQAERPIRVVARQVRGEVVSRAGPWRASGDWWTSQAWARDEWDVVLQTGALYRLCWDRPAAAWFVEGLYD